MRAVKQQVNCVVSEQSTMKLIQKFQRGELGNFCFKAESPTISKNFFAFLTLYLKSKQVPQFEF